MLETISFLWLSACYRGYTLLIRARSTDRLRMHAYTLIIPELHLQRCRYLFGTLLGTLLYSRSDVTPNSIQHWKALDGMKIRLIKLLINEPSR
jgi:hypothetical protein